MSDAARRWIVLGVALVLAALAVWRLEAARAGVEITDLTVGQTPVTRYALPGADGPPVVVAHGFAGSRQMMQGYALSLARAGYVAWAFDFQGHGRHPVPMSGDVDAIEGTTQRLVDQTRTVLQAALAREGAARAALLGHSMATDVLIRTALQTADAAPLVLLSAFSQAVDATRPRDMLLISGQWEPGLRDFALKAVRMVDPAAEEGELAQAGEVRRKAVVAPLVEHVGILHSRAGREAAVAWLNRAFGRATDPPVAVTGPWILALLAAIVALAYPLARAVPARAPPPPERLSARAYWTAALLPAVAAPLVAVWIPLRALPVLVADYLALHLLIFGLLQLALLWRAGLRPQRVDPWAVAALVAWGLGAFGLALHRYGANFMPTTDRLAIIAALALGAVAFMLGDALLSRGGREPLWRRIGARAAFLASLGLAVALDPGGLFFLVMIAPVIVLFYVVFGLMGRWVAARAGATSAGLALGLILAWALGVSFPIFSSGAGA